MKKISLFVLSCLTSCFSYDIPERKGDFREDIKFSAGARFQNVINPNGKVDRTRKKQKKIQRPLNRGVYPLELPKIIEEKINKNRDVMNALTAVGPESMKLEGLDFYKMMRKYQKRDADLLEEYRLSRIMYGTK